MSKQTQEDKIGILLEQASQKCEGANFHHLCGLPEELFANIRKLVPALLHLRLAKAIAQCVTDKI